MPRIQLVGTILDELLSCPLRLPRDVAGTNQYVEAMVRSWCVPIGWRPLPAILSTEKV